MLPGPRICGLFQLIMFALLVPAGASAQIQIQDGTTVYRVKDHENLDGMNVDFLTNGVDRVRATGWWYRADSATAEKRFPAPDSQSADGDTATLIWNDVNGDGFKATLRLTVIAGSGANAGTVQHKMTLEKLGAGSLTIALFNYSDIDLNNITGDTADFVNPPGEQAYLKVENAGDILYYHALQHDGYQVEIFSALRDFLNDASKTELDNSGTPFGPGDFTGGYQWILQPRQGNPAAAFMTFSANILPEFPTDTDGDGTADDDDLCPADDRKIEAGVCGCGVADTDSDGDGAADCEDTCSSDPGKTSPGVCGCGTADSDSDGDGTADCEDACPNDAQKTTAGICGCGVSDDDANGNGDIECGGELGTVNQEGLCVPGANDCAHQQLASTACVGVNGFLNQINIASVINLLPANLNVLVEYFDLAGELRGSVRNTIQANLKFDYIINDLGLLPDTVGTVCVTTNGAEGSWTGGVALYKPDERILPASQQIFGDGFDFALYYPFENLRTGSSTVPLNTFHLGTDPSATVANWIAISDGLRDGVPLRGTVFYYNDQGQEIARDAVNVPDGGRRDFAGHTGLTGLSNSDAIGMAVFVPALLPNGSPAPYLLTLTRYFYDCPGSSCNNFLTAFNIPNRPGTEDSIRGGVSTANAEISVVELNNNTRTLADTDVEVYAVDGQSLGGSGIEVPGRGTRHLIVNRVGATGFLAENSSGSAAVRARSSFVSALSIFYKLDAFNRLEYAYAVPFVGSPGQLQISQFNSFIGHTNTPELYNSGSSSATVDINYIDVAGNNVYGRTIEIPAQGTIRIENVPLPLNTFGTINVQSNKTGIVFRNYVSRPGQYTLSFGAQ